LLPGLKFSKEMVMKKLMVYVLKDRNGDVYRIAALSEEDARAWVMAKKYGKEVPSFLHSTGWLGLGLDLVSVEPRSISSRVEKS
jgi:hypothetical protein